MLLIVFQASYILDNLDPSVKPCDDFYRFACGKFLENTIIPDDKGSVDTFSQVSDKVQTQVRNIIEEDINLDNFRPLELAKILYESCMNQSKYLN